MKVRNKTTLLLSVGSLFQKLIDIINQMNVLSNFVLRVVFCNLIHSITRFLPNYILRGKVLVTQINMTCSCIIDKYQVFHFPSIL